MSTIATSGSEHDRITALGDQLLSAATYLTHLRGTVRSESRAAIGDWEGAAAQPAAPDRFDASAHALIEVAQSVAAMLRRVVVDLAAQDHSVALALFGA